MKATELIKPEDVRLGNYILDDKEIVKVSKSLMTYILEENHPFYPIELTEELLLRAGFKKLSSPEPTYSNESMIIFTHKSTGYKYFEYGIGENKRAIRRSECRYLHQLQNLYHALTGKELTLN